MTAILIHIGCTGPYIPNTSPPPYLERCIEQYLLFNTADLYILTDRVNIPLLKSHSGVFPIAIEDYYSQKVADFHSVFNYGPQEFWTVSTSRFIYLENFIRANNLHHVYHLENDVLIYFDIEKYAHVFPQLYRTMAACPCDPDHLTSAFMYFNDYTALERMNDFFIGVLAQYGVGEAQQQLHIDMANDMTLMKRYADVSGVVGILPVVPFGDASQGIEQFNAIFDGADWGQYICGTRVDGPGNTYGGHVVGGFIRAHPEWQVTWKVEDGLRFPYLCHEDTQVKMNNLHVHSKNMCPYMSKEYV